MTYIAQRRMKIGHDEVHGVPIYREAGEAVPEAASWSWQTIHTYLREGRLREAPDAEEAPKKARKGAQIAQST